MVSCSQLAPHSGLSMASPCRRLEHILTCFEANYTLVPGALQTPNFVPRYAVPRHRDPEERGCVAMLV